MSNVISIEGPVENINGSLALCIPLAAGGEQLARSAKGIGEVVGDVLIVNIPDWLADKIDVVEGSYVTVDNNSGKFNITKSPVS